ncbi:unnamed protein product [Phyllotreta striolata]|uniref:Uncharacterized protein n=1 Tax=Phyllotreta striolata TaxID=444603 RepID=A0A9P0GVD2_PHYSR|nr:unnamed protein product [Phyllotreta striolata]
MEGGGKQFGENYVGELARRRGEIAFRTSGLPKKTRRSSEVIFKPPPSVTRPHGDVDLIKRYSLGFGFPADSTSRRIKIPTRTSLVDSPAPNKHQLRLDSADSAGNPTPDCLASKIPLNRKSKEPHQSRPSDFHNNWQRENQTAKEKRESGHLRNLTELNGRPPQPFPAGGTRPLENRGKCEKYRKKPTLNGDFAGEKEFLIETNGLRTGESVASFKLPSNSKDSDATSLDQGSAFKTGKVSDTDSGIASPLSPGSVYGFLGHLDKVNGFPRKHPIGPAGREEAFQKNCCCSGERAQHSWGIAGRVTFSYEFASCDVPGSIRQLCRSMGYQHVKNPIRSGSLCFHFEFGFIFKPPIQTEAVPL